MNVETLYNLYSGQIYTLCMRLTANKSFADDVFGETWVKIAEKYRNIDSDRPPLNWMYSVCINCYKKMRHKEMKTISFRSEDEMEKHIAAIPGSTNLELEYTDREDMKSIGGALLSLKEIYRVPLILFYFKDLTYKDISGIMKIPIGSVKFRIHRAKELLREKLLKEKAL